MKKLLTIALIFVAFYGSAQNITDGLGNTRIQDIPDSLHKYTDSFMFYRCQVHCKEPKAGGFYLNKREKYRELAQHYYNLFDAKRTKTKVRFRSPDHYSSCPCQAPDTMLARLRDSIDYYREEWEFNGRKPDANYKRMLYFNILFRNRFDEKMKKS